MELQLALDLVDIDGAIEVVIKVADYVDIASQDDPRASAMRELVAAQG